MKKKSLVLLLAILLISGVWAGGGKQAQSSQITGDDDLSKRVKMTVLMGRQFDVPPGNPVEKMLGDLVNADIDFRLVDRATDSLNNTMNMIIASGEYPDMIQFLNLTHVNQYVDEGILLPVDDLLKQYGQEILAIRTEDMFSHCIFNGKKMVVPITDSREASVPIIRMDWLSKLGLAVPTTMEEYENCLKAFTEKGPGISGIKNTYGISSTNNPPNEVFAQVWAYVGVPPSGWQLRDGKLVAGQICPEVLDGLKLINKWFNNGWIDPEFPLYNREKFQEIIGTGTFGSYAWQAQRLDPAFDIGLAALYAREPSALFAAFAPVKDKNGNQGHLFHGDARSGNFFGISKTCVSPKRAMMLLNYAASEKGYLRIRYGVEGVNYQVVNGEMKWMPGWDDINRRTQEGLSIQYNNFLRREWTDRMINKTGRDAYAMMNSVMVPNAPIYVTTPAMLDMGPLRTQLEYDTQIKIMTAPPGTNVDAIWNDFVTKWLRDVGGQKITDEINAEYAKRK